MVSQVSVRTGHRLNVPPVVLRSLPREKLCVLLPAPPVPLHHWAASVQQVLSPLPMMLGAVCLRRAFFRQPWIADFSSLERRGSADSGTSTTRTILRRMPSIISPSSMDDTLRFR